MSKYSNAVEHLSFMASKGRLSLFLGTGFSKSLVDYIPNWNELVQAICNKLDICYDDICVDNNGVPRSPQNIASIIPFFKEIDGCPSDETYCECSREEIKKIVAKHIIKVTPEKEKIHQLSDYADSLGHINPKMVFTTNYDDITAFPFKNPKRIIPSSRYDNGVDGTRIIHIHGHYKRPKDMILFEEDFLKFNSENKYFHNCLYSSFVENTTLFIGYGLNDPNIKQILYNITQKEKKESCGRRFLFTVEDYQNHDIDYFERTFHVDVIKNENINQLLKDIATRQKVVQKLQKDITEFEITFVKLRDSNQVEVVAENEDLFIEILNGLHTHRKLMTEQSIKFIEKILEKIKEATYESGAFGQYGHLARYLILIGLKWPDIEKMEYGFPENYLEHFKYVLKASGDNIFGRSWASARLLSEEFNDQNRSNISFLKKDVEIQKNLGRLNLFK